MLALQTPLSQDAADNFFFNCVTRGAGRSRKLFTSVLLASNDEPQFISQMVSIDWVHKPRHELRDVVVLENRLLELVYRQHDTPLAHPVKGVRRNRC